MMKLATHLLLLMSMCAAAAASSSSSWVVDTDGDEVKTGVEYNLLASSAGGFSLASTGCKPCPLDVVQESSNLNLGLPLTFHPMNHDKPGRLVRLSTDLNIKFNAAAAAAASTNSSCADAAKPTLMWKLEHDRFMNKIVVTTGGHDDAGWFKFEKISPPAIYKLVFCPSASDSCSPKCGDLVFLADDQDSPHRRLLISTSSFTDERPFWVRIAKANYTQPQINNINGILTSH